MKSLSEEAVNIIRRRIITGEYHRGKQLKENELAAELNMSRSPVRQAMDKLAREFMIVHIPDKGSFVRGYSSREMEDFCQLRKTVEVMALKRTITNISESKLKFLKLKQSGPTEFHAALLTASESRAIFNAGYAYRDYTFLSEMAIMSEEKDLIKMEDEHEIIYELIREKDTHGAIGELISHIDTAHCRLMKYWSRHIMR